VQPPVGSEENLPCLDLVVISVFFFPATSVQLLSALRAAAISSAAAVALKLKFASPTSIYR
jgi:hypothetical protein